MRNEIGKKITGLIINKVQKKREMMHRTAIYSLGMAALFAVPAFYMLLGNRVSLQELFLLFLVVMGVSFTTIYLLLHRSKRLGIKEKQLKKANK